MSIKATVRGNLTGDPVAKEVTVKGERRTVWEVRIFSDEYKKTGDEFVQDDEACEGVDVTIWQEFVGQPVHDLLRKGARVEATGSLRVHRYKDRETGEPRASLQLTAEDVVLVLSRIEAISFKASRKQREALSQEIPA